MTIIDGRYVGDSKEEIRQDMFSTLQELNNGTLNPDNVGAIIELLDVYAEVLAIFESEMGAVLDSAHLRHAEGKALDYLVELKGVNRRPATKSNGDQKFYLDAPLGQDVLVPAGTTVKTASDVPTRFETVGKVTLQGPNNNTDSTTYSTTNTTYTTQTSFTIDVSNRDNVDLSVDFRTTDGTVTSSVEIVDSTNATQVSSGSTTSTTFVTDGPTSYDVSGMDGDVTFDYNLKTSDGTVGVELTNATADADGEVEKIAPVQAVEAGSDGNVGASNVVEWVSSRPHTDLKTTNPSAIDGGRDREDDEELRDRAQNAVDDDAKATLPALLQGLRELKNLESATIYYNDTDTDGGAGYGLPRQTIEPLLVYNDDDWQPVWDVLAETKAACEPTVAGYNGSKKSGTAKLDNGQDISINISEPVELTIYVDIDIDYIADNFEGTKVIKDNIVDYIGGYLSNGEYENSGLGTGSDVIYNDLKYQVMEVDGVYDINSLTVGTSDNPTGTTNVTVADNEVSTSDARPTTATIDVTTTEVDGPS